MVESSMVCIMMDRITSTGRRSTSCTHFWYIRNYIPNPYRDTVHSYKLTRYCTATACIRITHMPTCVSIESLIVTLSLYYTAVHTVTESRTAGLTQVSEGDTMTSPCTNLFVLKHKLKH